MIKSPFFVIQEFLSPLMCEDLIDLCDFTVPDTDKDGFDIRTIKTCEQSESIIYERLLTILPSIQEYYDFKYKGTEPVIFEWFPQGSQGQLLSENSNYVRHKWLRTRQRDFTGTLFLSDYQDTPSFEPTFEVYGGKLEFPQHGFGFNPQRGTLIIYPSDPHFINGTSLISAGNLFQAKIQIAAISPYLYDPSQFPGNYISWFSAH